MAVLQARGMNPPSSTPATRPRPLGVRRRASLALLICAFWPDPGLPAKSMLRLEKMNSARLLRGSWLVDGRIIRVVNGELHFEMRQIHAGFTPPPVCDIYLPQVPILLQ
jgi:hypothetical protein